MIKKKKESSNFRFKINKIHHQVLLHLIYMIKTKKNYLYTMIYFLVHSAITACVIDWETLDLTLQILFFTFPKVLQFNFKTFVLKLDYIRNYFNLTTFFDRSANPSHLWKQNKLWDWLIYQGHQIQKTPSVVRF